MAYSIVSRPSKDRGTYVTGPGIESHFLNSDAPGIGGVLDTSVTRSWSGLFKALKSGGPLGGPIKKAL